MIIHGVETKPYGHGKCSLLSNRTDPNNLTTLLFPNCPWPVWTDRYNPHWDGRTTANAESGTTMLKPAPAVR